jgi:hypothetical protein
MRKVGLIVLVLVIAPLAAFAQQGWYVVHCPIGVSDFDVKSDSFIAAFDGGSGTVLSQDGGQSWVIHHNLSRADQRSYNSIKALNSSTLQVFGHNEDPANQYYALDLIETSTDSGKTWAEFTQEGSYCYKVLEHSVEDWFLGDYFGGNGNWFGFTSVIDGNLNHLLWIDGSWGTGVCGVDRVDSNVMMIFGIKQTQIQESTNFGANWTTLPLNLRMLDAGDPSTIHYSSPGRWFVSDSCDLLMTTDFGDSWNKIRTFGTYIEDFQFIDSIGYLVLRNQDYIEKTTDGGITWYPENCYNGSSYVRHVEPSSKNVAYGWSNSSDVMRTSDGGFAPGPVLNMQRLIAFGSLLPGKDSTLTVWVSNAGIGQLQVSGYLTDTARVKISPSSFVLGPTDSILLKITFSTFNGAGDNIPVSLQTNSVPPSQNFHVTGSALTPTLSYSQTNIDFGVIAVGETQLERVQVRNGGIVTAIFGEAGITGPEFSCVVPDTLQASKYASGTLTLRFSSTVAGSFSRELIVNSNALHPDTLLLHGVAVQSLGGSSKLAWQRLSNIADTLQAAATNVAITNIGLPIVFGMLQQSQAIQELRIEQYNSDGQMLSAKALDSNGQLFTSPLKLCANSAYGFDLAYTTNHNGNRGICLVALDYFGLPLWRDTTLEDTTGGMDNTLPLSIAADGRGNSMLVSSGYTTPGYTFPSQQGQLLSKIYDPHGSELLNVFVNGPSRYVDHWYGLHNGPDYGTSLIASESNFFSSNTLDYGTVDYNWNGGSNAFSGEVWEYASSKYIGKYSESNSSGAGMLTYSNGIVYEAGKYQDTSFYLLELDTGLNPLRRGSVDKSTGLDSIYGVEVDSSDASAYLLGTAKTSLAGENTILIRMSPDAKELWQKQFDGLGSANDIPVKLLVDHSNAYVLVQSADTNGDDFVLLKYDSSGNLLFRQRYDGPGHAEDVPRDFAISPDGSIYVVGGATNTNGAQAFTVLRYVDSTLASVNPHVTAIPGTLDARLSSNPWTTSSTLEISKAASARVTVHVCDILGREFYSTLTTANALSLNAGQFPAGFYAITITDEAGARKILKFVRL